MDQVLPVVTLIIGYMGALATEWLRDARSVRKDRRLARERFQRDTLIALQDALQQLYWSMNHLLLDRLKAAAQTGRWPSAEELQLRDEMVQDARVPVIALKARIADETTRSLVERFLAREEAASVATGKDGALAAQGEAQEAFVPAVERIGELLRDA